MGYTSVYAENMVPQGLATEWQLQFYDAIRWLSQMPLAAPGDTFISPPLHDGAELPVFSYWQTLNSRKLQDFELNYSNRPSRYALGNRLPGIQNLVQVTLGMQSDDAVHQLHKMGGRTLRRHAEEAYPGRGHPLTEYGRQVLEFTDPWKYLIRLAAMRPDEFYSPTSGDPIQVTINIPDTKDRDENRKIFQRLFGFYDAIGFRADSAPTGIGETYVGPAGFAGAEAPIITYKMVDDKTIANRYSRNGSIRGSEFYAGAGLRAMYDLVEVCLILPDNDAVQNSYDEAERLSKGIFALHAHVKPHTHDGRLEYRFTDPFNIAIRVTSPSKLIASVTQNFREFLRK